MTLQIPKPSISDISKRDPHNENSSRWHTKTCVRIDAAMESSPWPLLRHSRLRVVMGSEGSLSFQFASKSPSSTLCIRGTEILATFDWTHLALEFFDTGNPSKNSINQVTQHRVCRPFSVTFHNQTPIFKWCVVMCRNKRTDTKYICVPKGLDYKLKNC